MHVVFLKFHVVGVLLKLPRFLCESLTWKIVPLLFLSSLSQMCPSLLKKVDLSPKLLVSENEV